LKYSQNKKLHTNIGVHLFDQILQNCKSQQLIEFSRVAEYQYWTWRRYRMWHKIFDGLSKKPKNTKPKINLTVPQRIQQIFSWIASGTHCIFLGYGLKPMRFVFWSLVIFFTLVTIIFYNQKEFGFQGSLVNSSKLSYLSIAYYTAVTASTLGYGDITPLSDFGMVLASAISILGLVWMGLLTSLIVKRFIR